MKGRKRPRKARWFREDLVGWLLVAAASSSILLATDYWLNRRVLPADRDLPPAVPEPKIVALAFDRIVSEPAPNKITGDELRRHLRTLESEGFVAVSLEALARFYENGEPLPEKSLVLTFDHGYLSTYNAVDPVLRELGWPAVLFVMTERQERRDPFFVYWDRVEHMIASGLWEIASHGHNGHDPIPVDEGGGTGPFFIRRRWLAEAFRIESWQEFSERVQGDHDRAKSILSQRTGREILAYAPPLRDVAGLSAAPEAHQATREIVESTYRLAFFDDRFGVNDGRSDPTRLKRLRVEPGLGPEKLGRRIQFALGGATPPEMSWAEPWVAGSGEATLEGEELVLRGLRRADVWRAGSKWVEDWELESDVYTDGGELWVVQESDSGPEQWRIGGTAGRTYLQTRSPGERTEVVESYRAAMDPSRWHHLKLIKRGAGVWVALDGEPLSEHPTYLPGRWRGNVGIVHWNPGETGVRLRGLRFREVPFDARVLPSSLPTEEIQAAIADAPCLSALSPRLFEIDSMGLYRAPVDGDLLKILSSRFAWEIVPTVRISGADPEVSSAALAEILSEVESFEGLRVEWSGASEALRKTVVSALETRARELSWKAGRLVVSESEENP
ncbi:MAG TPA: polysaccharide deacetylase family protein [Vicinamibacteria bacterium]|nr:polysaccharide deacetylase family protein [Vicinamibacteria bacterium]